MVSRPNGEQRIAGSGGAQGQSEAALWVRSFLLAQPGKTYRIESTDDAREAAAGQGIEAAARVLAAEVERRARDAGTVHTTAPDRAF